MRVAILSLSSSHKSLKVSFFDELICESSSSLTDAFESLRDEDGIFVFKNEFFDELNDEVKLGTDGFIRTNSFSCRLNGILKKLKFILIFCFFVIDLPGLVQKTFDEEPFVAVVDTLFIWLILEKKSNVYFGIFLLNRLI